MLNSKSLVEKMVVIITPWDIIGDNPVSVPVKSDLLNKLEVFSAEKESVLPVLMVVGSYLFVKRTRDIKLEFFRT